LALYLDDVFPAPAVAHDLEVWANISSCGRHLNISDSRGCNHQLVDAFRGTDLRSWVHPARDFSRALTPLLDANLDWKAFAMPCTLGTYTFTSPVQCPLRINFQATLTAVDVDDGQEDDLWYFTLTIGT